MSRKGNQSKTIQAAVSVNSLQLMNNIRDRAMEIVNHELIYA